MSSSEEQIVEATGDVIADFVHALDLHKARIRKLQDALCECPHREFFQASLHDETCPVYIIGAQPPASVPSPPEPACKCGHAESEHRVGKTADFGGYCCSYVGTGGAGFGAWCQCPGFEARKP